MSPMSNFTGPGWLAIGASPDDDAQTSGRYYDVKTSSANSFRLINSGLKSAPLHILPAHIACNKTYSTTCLPNRLLRIIPKKHRGQEDVLIGQLHETKNLHVGSRRCGGGLRVNDNETIVDPRSADGWRFLESYSKTRLTIGTDRLQAISGIIAVIKSATGWDNLFGLLVPFVFQGLLWRAFTPDSGGSHNNWRC
ncbi:hypothetical protein B0T25DRAFT_519452 [Lasiosphaeria hispida]|uniref:Uncharacterized protein n=1 Tax=Lasiosphaeria hispida TaxID=260671 RepID=A0AAJ0HE26_9PEZI|nr:hypothetical protein B0T25DRAFT_519452 [Lasiosphaeria hispida]